ncbi:class I SAM-dependent methyltransferase [bacterium]|nr:class I SAM-dependent methyltransferase [bacterium]
MKNSTDYKKDTLDAYRTPERALEYKNFHTKDWSWGRFVTWLEHKKIARELSRYTWTSSDQLLDIPCGTGILGELLHNFPFKIVASDISPEMMAMAKEEYPQGRLLSCTQADITKTPFARSSFACVVTLGFLHRVPLDIKRAALKEIAALTSKLAIVTCSVDTPLQRFKHFVLSRIKRNHVPAPCPMPLNQIAAECELHGFKVKSAAMVLPLLSADAVFVLEKKT